jgi:hypothetical protein
MTHELYFTSAPRGLSPGSNGYCTVTATRGLPGPLYQKLEALSDYGPLGDGDESTGRYPISLVHVRLSVLGKMYSVLSRICMAGVDHSRRKIFFAHHVALDATELPPGGPGWLVGQTGFLEARWDGQVRELPAGRAPLMGDSTPGVCRAWQQAAGDAGWAGVLAEEFEKNPTRPVYLLCPSRLDPLPLLQEALALLPPERRWQVSFSTLYRPMPQDVTCLWRCLPLDSPEVARVRSQPGALVLDLGKPFGPADGGPLVEAARTGKIPEGSVHLAARAPQPVPGGKAWKPSVPVAAEPKRESAPEPIALTVVEEIATSAQARGGSWFVPFALGLVAGVLLIGGGAVAGWRVLENAQAKAAGRASEEAREHEAKAVAAVEAKRKTDLDESERRLAAVNASASEEKKIVSGKAATAASRASDLQVDLRKMTRERDRARRQIEEEKKHAGEAARLRNRVLKMLADSLFAEKSRESEAIRKLLKAVEGGKEVKLAELDRRLDEWVRHELEILQQPELTNKLYNLGSYLKKCNELWLAYGGPEASVKPSYKKNYDEAVKVHKQIVKSNTSLLVRKAMERVAKELAKLPEPVRPKES